jgi:hypothetical protein
MIGPFGDDIGHQRCTGPPIDLPIALVLPAVTKAVEILFPYVFLIAVNVGDQVDEAIEVVDQNVGVIDCEWLALIDPLSHIPSWVSSQVMCVSSQVMSELSQVRGMEFETTTAELTPCGGSKPFL